MPVTTVRIDKEELLWLDELADRQDVDRSALIKRALRKGVREILIEEAVAKYLENRCSAWAAAEEANISLWEFLEELRKRNVPFRTDESEIEKELEELA